MSDPARLPFDRRACETVFLDAGGVLVHPNWERVAEALTRQGVQASAHVLRAAEPRAKYEMDHGALMARTDDRQRGWIYFESVLRHAGLTVDEPARRALDDVRAYHDEHNVWEYVPADVVPMLQALRALGVRLVVVSNANGRLHAMFDRVGLSAHVDIALDSHHWGVEKPDPRLFHLALAESGAEAARTIHVGDFFHIDVVGARAAGLAEAVLFDVADLYKEAACRRIRRLDELVPLVGAAIAGA
ncbi:MAG: HAD family hydrolase [Vicinamibacterales bacterium]